MLGYDAGDVGMCLMLGCDAGDVGMCLMLGCDAGDVGMCLMLGCDAGDVGMCLMLGCDAGDVAEEMVPDNTQQSLNSQSYLAVEDPSNIPDLDEMAVAGLSFICDGIFHCNTCKISLCRWKRNDDPWKEHAKHSPACSYLRDQKGQAYITRVQEELTMNVTRPEYMEITSRIGTYDNPNWPVDQVTQRPEELAGAGLFYTGEGATVTCHDCGISFCCLPPHAEPWADHACSSPSCKYLIRMKGINFVENFEETEDMDLPVSIVSMTRFTPASILRSMKYSSEVIMAAINQHRASKRDKDIKVGDLLELISDMEGGDKIVEEDYDLPSYDEMMR
ncbi:E3 ubiquitin-protein ligase XIAP-like [Ylistrum balloti]|uniref:E3 ubiquitin-protein ligase XIAP-like n=1 Tax=Ylistrum balloti TaxID=509963 RepID=UPI002905A873|nr:E3 ubiquitin-protein ligase XIAP-like [Ylistrum balloti]